MEDKYIIELTLNECASVANVLVRRKNELIDIVEGGSCNSIKHIKTHIGMIDDLTNTIKKFNV